MKKQISVILLFVLFLTGCGKSKLSVPMYTGTWLGMSTDQNDSSVHHNYSLILYDNGTGTYLKDEQKSITWKGTSAGITITYAENGKNITETFTLQDNNLIDENKVIFRNNAFKSNNNITENTTGKGQKNNPYLVDETILFQTCLISDPTVKFNVSLTVPSLTSAEKEAGKQILKSFLINTDDPIFAIKFKISSTDGSYSKPIEGESSGGFAVRAVSRDGSSLPVTLFNEASTTSSVDKFYADFDQFVYGSINPSGNLSNIQFLTIEYATDTYETETIWVDLSDLT